MGASGPWDQGVGGRCRRAKVRGAGAATGGGLGPRALTRDARGAWRVGGGEGARLRAPTLTKDAGARCALDDSRADSLRLRCSRDSPPGRPKSRLRHHSARLARLPLGQLPKEVRDRLAKRTCRSTRAEFRTNERHSSVASLKYLCSLRTDGAARCSLVSHARQRSFALLRPIVARSLFFCNFFLFLTFNL